MKALQNEKVNIKIILSALWIAVMFIYVYADIKTLFQPEIPEQIISGIMGGMTINQSFLFAAAVSPGVTKPVFEAKFIRVFVQHILSNPAIFIFISLKGHGILLLITTINSLNSF